MIKQIDGNILDATEDIICHQVNCQGVMGSGLAKQIKIKYPKVYENYKHICNEYKSQNKSPLGEVIWGVITSDNKIIANLCGQDKYGTDKQYTDYKALRMALEYIYNAVKNPNSVLKNYSIAIPYKMGCGLAGGDWNIVYKIIEDVFKDYYVVIYKYNS